jgi:protein SCO1/2
MRPRPRGVPLDDWLDPPRGATWLVAALVLLGLLAGCAAPRGAALAEPRPGGGVLAGAGAPALPPRALVSQDGEPVRLEALLDDRVVVLSFGYVRCTGTCPLTTANLRSVQAALGERLGEEILLVTITLDPEHDTPEVLRAYADESGAGPGWLFLTGAPRDVDATRAALGFVQRGVDPAGARKDHAAMVLVGSGRVGRWMKLPALSPAQDIAAAALRLEDARARLAAAPSGHARAITTSQ